jgi:hypothetical protein
MQNGSHLWPLALEKRKEGRCPLEPGEIGFILRAMGYTKETQIYVASGQVYGGNNRMAPLRNMFPNLVGALPQILFVAFVLPSYGHSAKLQISERKIVRIVGKISGMIITCRVDFFKKHLTSLAALGSWTKFRNENSVVRIVGQIVRIVFEPPAGGFF